jgi:hypothetical protein
LLRCPLRAKLALLFLTINPENPWKAALLLEIPMGGLNDRLLLALYYL